MEQKNDYILGTAGHIDHGKTALVRALTGVDTDRLPAEKRRGITIDLGFAAIDFGAVRISLVDVPGHEKFVRNMLAGASGFDLALLVVAADDSVMPQTREHFEILKLLGIQSGVIALSKCDLVDEDWIQLVEDEIRGLLAGSFLEDAPIIRTSAATGLGIDLLRATLRDSIPNTHHLKSQFPFAMGIDRCFTIQGHGAVVTGTIVTGTVAVGDELELMPVEKAVRVRGIQSHGQSVERIGRGARAAINLTGVRLAELERGQVIAAPTYLKPSNLISVRLQASEEATRPLRHRRRYRVHLGTTEVPGVLTLLDTNELQPGQTALAQLRLEDPIAAVFGQPFVIREESPAWTVGGGVILQPIAGRIRRRDQLGKVQLQRINDPDPAVRLSGVLSGYDRHAWTRLDLIRDVGVTDHEALKLVESLEESGRLIEVPVASRRILKLEQATVEALEDRVLRALQRLHQKNQRLSAVRRSNVLGELMDLDSETLVDSLIDRLSTQKKVVATPRTVAIAGYKPQLTKSERRLKTSLATTIAQAGIKPPLVAELAEESKVREETIRELLDLLVEEGLLVLVAPNLLYLDSEVEAGLRKTVRSHLLDVGSVSMAGLRDLLGTTRKYAVPIGEYLDQIGLTIREGDLRILGRSEVEERVANPSS